MSGQSQFLSLAPEMGRPHITTPAAQFLSLAPAVSESHPRAQRPRAESSASSSTASGGSSPTLSATSPVEASATSPSSRVLKLSPVHWGAHAEECQSDYHNDKSV